MNYLAFALAAALGAAFAFGAAAPSWIANFGVVPLLRLAAFLLAPIALCFALRRFSVTAVLEAMAISQSKIRDLVKMKHLNVAITLIFVKAFLLLPVAAFAQMRASDIILSKGEQKELSFPGLKNFSVGNAEIISYKFMPKSGKLLVKGKSVGFTDLIVWTEKGK
jgi:Flp pilus assembly secretin CpaC